MAERDIGVVGLAVMGRNLALNILDKGFSLSVYNRSPEPVQQHRGQRQRPQEEREAARVVVVAHRAGEEADGVVEVPERQRQPGQADRGDRLVVVVSAGLGDFHGPLADPVGERRVGVDMHPAQGRQRGALHVRVVAGIGEFGQPLRGGPGLGQRGAFGPGAVYRADRGRS